MCLYSDGVAKIADEDICVWKKVGVSERGDSWRGFFEYNDKVFPFDEMCEETGAYDREHSILGGFFHSYANKWNAMCLHHPIRKREEFRFPKTAVVECTIPKGAVYYANPGCTEYASDRIIVHKPKNI